MSTTDLEHRLRELTADGLTLQAWHLAMILAARTDETVTGVLIRTMGETA